MADFNRDLLLAALAQLTDALPREVLRRALARWTGDPSRPLTEYLLESGEVEAAQLRALESLVSGHLAKHQGDLKQSLDAWNGVALTQSLLTEVASGPGVTTLAEALETVLSGNSGPTLALGDSVKERGVAAEGELPNFTQGERFRLIRKHARGGIGEVWVAQDRELRREVAVKEIQERYVDRKDQRQRFLLEAEITGSLEHPGIVPVYSLGRNELGRPFYAMRFIRGESLSAAIRRFHEGRRKSDPGGCRRGSLWGIEFQQLLRRFLDVCDAMEYAHSRNVIHRDLKPANIMLGDYGETLVVDWGLAKVLGRCDIAAAEAGGVDVGNAPGAAGVTPSVHGETQPGSLIGTPSYMSPEQANGDVEHLSPASDVYSLGATLYELLTGIIPFAAQQTQEVIDRVKQGALIPPRTLVPDLPAPLEAICLKAMAFRPEQRYASARDIASDLEHWMADEPVSAYPERRLQRVSRWLRRHRSWTYAGAAALLGITLVATVAVFIVDRSRRGEEEARRQAEDNFKMAQEAVDQYLTRVSENTLLKEQETTDLRKLRKDLLASALPFYQSFVLKGREEPTARQQLANAYFRLGAITEVIESTAKALELYEASVILWEPLVRAHPENVGYGHRLADCYLAIGRLRREQDPGEAIPWLSAALDLYGSLALKDPAEVALQASIADCYSELGLCYSYKEDVKKALEVLGQGRSVQEELVQRDPDNIELRKNLAEIVNRMGFVAYKRRDYDAALEIYEEFQEICFDILKRLIGPRPQKISESLARSYYNIGTMRLERSQYQLALEAFHEAEKLYATLVNDNPTVYSYQQSLGQAHLSIATAQYHLKEYNAARESVSKASSLFERLLNAEPHNQSYRRDKGLLLDLTGTLHDVQRRNDLAEPCFREALELRQERFRSDPASDGAKRDLCMSLTNLGETYLDLGDHARGLPLYLRALEHRRELALSNPEEGSSLRDFAELSLTVGEIQLQSGQDQAALRTYEQAAGLLEDRLKGGPAEPALQALLATIQLREARSRLPWPESSIAVLRQLVVRLRDLVKAAPEEPALRGVLTEALWELAKSLQGPPNAGEADRLQAERRSLWGGRAAGPLVELARQEAAHAHLIGYGKAPLPEAGEAARGRALDRAAANLRLAFHAGFKDLLRIQADPDLAPLLERADLKTVAGRVPQPEPPPQR